MSDKRHIDYFGTVLEFLDRAGVPFCLLINDLKDDLAAVKEQFVRDIEDYSKKKGYVCRTASDSMEKRLKFSLVVSVFEHLIRVPYGRVKMKAILKKRVASLIYPLIKLRVSSLLFPQKYIERIVGYSRMGDQSSYQIVVPEKALGRKSVFFPKGLDLDPSYPREEMRHLPDYFFCHGNLDEKLILQNTGNSAIHIGYPRYDNFDQFEEEKSLIFKEFGMNPDLKLVTWLPTYFPDGSNIDQWKEEFADLASLVNVLIRPHPKQIQRSKQDLVSELKQLGLFVDVREERAMTELYAASDLICCDYGGTIFSAIYTRASLLLLDTLEHHKIAAERPYSEDIRIRETLFYLNSRKVKEAGGLLQLLNDPNLEKQQEEQRNLIRKEYFGSVEIGEGTQLCAEALCRLAGFGNINLQVASE